MLGQLQNKFKGRVEIEITGPGLERFFNLCLQRGIVLRDIKWLNSKLVLAKIPAKSFHQLRPIVRQSNCRVRIRRRLGLPFFYIKLKKRKIFALGAILFALCFFAAGNLVLRVDVESPYPLKREFKEQLLAAKEDAGIKTGRLRWFIDFDRAEREYQRLFPSLIWLNIDFKGTVVYINVVERTDIGEEDSPKPPGDIVAKKDGIIQDMLVKKGTPMAAAGDTVIKGQVLIIGEDLKGPLAASGIIRAKVWYEGYGEAASESKYLKESGRKYRQIILFWAGKPRLYLEGGKKIPFEKYIKSQSRAELTVWRKIKLPVEVLIIEYREQKEYIENIGAAAAWDFALQGARQAALREMPEKAEILNIIVNKFPDEGRVKRVKIIVEALEDIAVFKSPSVGKLAE